VKLITLFFTIFIIIPQFGYPNELDQAMTNCNKELAKYFKNPANSDKIKEYVRLKAEVSFHRAAHALFYDDAKSRNKTSSTFSTAVQRAISKLDEKTLDDPEFKRARASFEELPLSRKNFAEILPFIVNILNTNRKLSPNDQSIYGLDDSDIKLFHMLAVAEGEKATRQNIKQFTNKNHIQSILNFPRTINWLIENNGNDIFASTSLEKKLKSSLRKIDDFLYNLDISSECKVLCEINVGNPFSHQNFLDMAEHFLEINAIDRVRFQDLYLHIGKSTIREKETIGTPIIASASTTIKSQKTKGEEASPSGDNTTSSKKPVSPSPLEANPRPEQKLVLEPELPETEDKPEDKAIEKPNQDPRIEFLTSKILKEYAYFFTREDLRSDPDLVIAISHAMDAKNKKFFYKGDAYWLPNQNTTDSHKVALQIIKEIQLPSYNLTSYLVNMTRDQFNEKMADKQEARRYAMSVSPDVQNFYDRLSKNTPNCATNSDGSQNDDFQVMLALSMHGAKGSNLNSFVFNKKYCDAKTGKIISATKEGFLSFKRGPWQNSSTIPELQVISSKRQELIDQALREGKNNYIMNGSVYLISGFKVPYKEHVPENKDASLSIISAERNGDQITQHQDEIYLKGSDKKWRKLTETEIDDQVKSHTKGTIDITSMTPSLKRSAVIAIRSNKPTFTHEGIKYSTQSITPESTQVYKATDSINNDRLRILKSQKMSSNEETIHQFHQTFGNGECNFYTIVDKPNKLIKVFSNNNQPLWSKEVLTGKVSSDKRIQWVDKSNNRTNNITPAGIFTLGERKQSENYGEYYQKYYEGNLIDIKPEKGSSYGSSTSNPFALHQIPPNLKSRRLPLIGNGNLKDNRETGGCVNLPKEDMIEYQDKYHSPGCPFYVVPEEEHLGFEIDFERKKLSMITNTPTQICNQASTNGCSNDYLLSPVGTAISKIPPRPIHISYDDNIFNGVDSFWYEMLFNGKKQFPLNTFISSIEVNKAEIMSHYSITNEEYNELAKIAVGVMGVESELGLHKKYLLKEFPALNEILWPDDASDSMIRRYSPDGQDIVDLGKMLTNGTNDPNNSRGPTQIKKVSSFLPAGVSITEDELNNPAKAGVATMHVLINLYNELKRMQDKGELKSEVIFPGSTEGKSNISEYIYYLYNGDKGSLKSGTATPDQNRRVQKMKHFMQYVEVKQFLD